jgi:hypothetical protein
MRLRLARILTRDTSALSTALGRTCLGAHIDAFFAARSGASTRFDSGGRKEQASVPRLLFERRTASAGTRARLAERIFTSSDRFCLAVCNVFLCLSGNLRMLVSLMFASWNQIGKWLRRLDAIQRVA